MEGGERLREKRGEEGGGRKDGEGVVENIENMNTANNYWEKNYKLNTNVEKEKERFQEFEGWW